MKFELPLFSGDGCGGGEGRGGEGRGGEGRGGKREHVIIK